MNWIVQGISFCEICFKFRVMDFELENAKPCQRCLTIHCYNSMIHHPSCIWKVHLVKMVRFSMGTHAAQPWTTVAKQNLWTVRQIPSKRTEQPRKRESELWLLLWRELLKSYLKWHIASVWFWLLYFADNIHTDLLHTKNTAPHNILLLLEIPSLLQGFIQKSNVCPHTAANLYCFPASMVVTNAGNLLKQNTRQWGIWGWVSSGRH